MSIHSVADSHKASVWKTDFFPAPGKKIHCTPPTSTPPSLRSPPSIIHRFLNRNYSFASAHPSNDNCETNSLESRWYTHKSFQEK